MTPPADPCPRCGTARPAGACGACHGSARSLDGRHELAPAGPDGPLAALRGFGDVVRAVAALLHGREFIGLLRLPVLGNAVAFVLLVVGGWLLLAPRFEAAFAGPWWLGDGWRAACADRGPAAWLATSWLLLGPPLLELCAGAAQEPLRAATERRMLGPASGAAPRSGMHRLRERARVLAVLLLAWPAALALVLVPWIGWPLVLAVGSATAAVVWFEAPMAPRGLDLPARLRALRHNPWRALGTGLGVQLAAAVPFVNLLALAPVATVAATASWLQFDHRRR